MDSAPNSSTDSRVLEKLKAVLLQADELGLSKTHAEQLARIRSLCGDIFGEKPVNLSFGFFSLIYRIFRTSCEFFLLINSTVAINSSKKSQSEPESLCIIKEKNP